MKPTKAIAPALIALTIVAGPYGPVHAQQSRSFIGPSEKGAVISVSSVPVKVESPFWYQVAPGDNLHWLAARFYGDARQWTRIYHANKALVRNPNRLPVGLDLWIPATEDRQ